MLPLDPSQFEEQTDENENDVDNETPNLGDDSHPQAAVLEH